MPTQERAIEIVQAPIDDLHPDPGNPRHMPDTEMEALCRSLERFGFVEPIVARHDDHVVIGGHQRLAAARRLGMTEVPVVYLDVDRQQARVLGIALNRIGGGWDEQLLARLLADLQATPGVDVSLSGFGDDEIGELLKTLSAREKRERQETFDLDEAWERARREPRVQPGERWLLDDHVLLCGDATNPDDVARLLGDRHAAMAFTDPPYNVALGDHGGRQRDSRRRQISNDALSAEEWETFCRAWAPNLLDNVDGSLYVCMSSREWPTVARILAEAGGHWSDTIIWAKDRFTLGRADYQHQYEPVWYGWRNGARRHWCGDRDQGDVWSIPRPSQSPLHPTMKPLALVERAIANSSLSGDLVLDLFLGSGSTLIAAERTGRRCAGLELDPYHCTVILARWEAFTGQQARREDSD